MPQINQLLLVYQSQWFWLLLVIGVIYFVIARGMAPKIEATVDARDAKIADDLAAAQQARAAADEGEEAVRIAVAQSRSDAQGISAAAKAAAAKNAEKALAKADADIAIMVTSAEAKLAAAHADALTNIQSVAADAARDIVAKLTGTKITAPAATSAVKAVLGHG